MNHVITKEKFSIKQKFQYSIKKYVIWLEITLNLIINQHHYLSRDDGQNIEIIILNSFDTLCFSL